MKRRFASSVAKEENWFVAQCLAMELYLGPPLATQVSSIRLIEVEVEAA